MLNNINNKVLGTIIMVICLSVTACTTVTIDQTRTGQSNLAAGESIVVLGRRSANDYETEPDLVSCVSKVLANNAQKYKVIMEQEFVDSLYPWFEPRTAPARVSDLKRLLEHEELSKAIEKFNLHYFIWIDGSTVVTRNKSQISCAITPAGGACFGFGSWDDTAEYEATIWDYHEKKLVGKISSMVDGTSYIPAIVIPIPLIATVQADACKAMGLQLRSFFIAD